MSYTDIQTSCLENLIGLESQGCSGIESTSGYYASSVGITKNFISQILTNDFKDAESFFLSKRAFATQLVTDNLHTYYSPKYKAVSVIDSFRSGRYNENMVSVAPTSSYKGIFFDVCAERSYLDFFLSEVSLFVNHSGPIPIVVYDLMQNKLLDTFSITAVAGEVVRIYPHNSYATKNKKLQLFIGYDDTGITSYKTTIYDNGCSDCQPSWRVSNSFETISSVTIPTTSDFIKSSTLTSTDTGGLSVVHSLTCNHRDWLCTRANLLAHPILYKTASEIFQFALLESKNTRSNTTNSLNEDLLRERYRIAELNFSQSMDRVLASSNPPNDDLCFECHRSAKVVIALP